MSRNKIELQVLSLTYSQEQAGAYALLLGEVDGPRKLPVIIGSAEAQAILLEIRGITSPRPLTYQLFASTLEALGVRLLRILIYRAENGLFYSYLYLQSDHSIIRIDSRTSDAVVMAMHLHCPIFIYEDVLDAEKMELDAETLETESGTTNSQDDWAETISRMEEALKEAIEAEEYEKAANLRDMINQFKESNHQD